MDTKVRFLKKTKIRKITQQSSFVLHFSAFEILKRYYIVCPFPVFSFLSDEITNKHDTRLISLKTKGRKPYNHTVNVVTKLELNVPGVVMTARSSLAYN